MYSVLLNRVRETIKRHHLLTNGERLIVGVSAGVDSMVLLHVLCAFRDEFDLSFIVAHVNHGFRPNESEKEAELVQKTSEKLGLPFEYGQFNVKDFQRTEGLSPQDAARKIRFHFFNKLLQKHHAQKIALGHTADDQVETVILRLIRGSGLRGLKGMEPSREGRVIRPLLEVWRKEIEDYAVDRQIPYLTDSSNLKEDYLRNRIRRKLIPLIEGDYQPNFKRRILKTSEILRDEDEILEKEASEAYSGVVEEHEGAVSFRYSAFQSLPRGLQWRVLRKCFSGLAGDRESPEEKDNSHLDQAYQMLIQPPASFLYKFPGGVCLEKRYDQVSLSLKRTLPVPPFEVELSVPGRTFVKEIGKAIVSAEIGKDELPEQFDPLPHVAYLDYQRLEFPLILRNFRPGDRFQPLGVRGTQKLKEFFIDHKVSRFERATIPLVVSGGEIVWVVGHRISEKVKITDHTLRILRVEAV